MPTLEFDRQFFNDSCRVIAGTDEAGRGPLAGPVVAAACILPADFLPPGLDDSKKLSEKKREQLYDLISLERDKIRNPEEESDGRELFGKATIALAIVIATGAIGFGLFASFRREDKSADREDGGTDA